MSEARYRHRIRMRLSGRSSGKKAAIRTIIWPFDRLFNPRSGAATRQSDWLWRPFMSLTDSSLKLAGRLNCANSTDDHENSSTQSATPKTLGISLS
jgi:hypothetical protein